MKISKHTPYIVYPQMQALHTLLRVQTEQRIDAIAVGYNDQYLSYGELNRRANQLAHYLIKRGVGPEVLVGICLNRSPEMAIALLGVLKAGGGYVPLDPAYPPQRLNYIIQDAQLDVVITEQSLLPILLENGVSTAVCLAKEWSTISLEPDNDPTVSVDIHQVAYVLYTSGSTGQPKGVVVTHYSLVNHGYATADAYKLHALDRVLQFASISFDVAAEELFPTWLAGGTVILRPYELMSFQEFGQYITREQLTVLNLPASYWHEWVTHLVRSHEKLPTHLRAMIVGSERVLPERLRQWLQVGGDTIRWWNAYGPTEATITATVYEHQGEIVDHIPIGRSLANITTHILDETLQPVPVNALGELYIGGVALARGYLSRPGLTGEKFIPDPFSQCGARLYKTGDQVRRLPDEQILFWGRVDHQTKIRGFRIELGEIEAVLRQHPDVHEVVVGMSGNDTSEEEPTSVNLVAYVVPEGDANPSSKDLRQFLEGCLPNYMIPTAYIMLQALPLTPNGKIDRRALLVSGTAESSRKDIDAARTPMEKLLAGIWMEVLGTQVIGIYDDFFERGGQSLMALQIVSRINAALQCQITLQALFENPTIAELAVWLATVPQDERQEILSPAVVPTAMAEADIRLSWGQQQLWLIDQLSPGNIAYNILLVLRLDGWLDVSILHECIHRIVERHEILRTAFPLVDGQAVQRIAPELMIPLPVIDLQFLAKTEREAEAEQLAYQEGQRPFLLSQTPLLRTLVVQLESQKHLLLLNAHHIITDGWSLAVFTQELADFYQALQTRMPPALPTLPIQYKDFSVWQRQRLQDDFLAAQIAFWQSQLAGATTVLNLPTDRKRPLRQTSHGARQWFFLPKELGDALQTLSQKAGTTLFMTLFASYAAFLNLYTGQKDIVIGAPIAGRTSYETEHLIGYFINMLVLRTTFEEDTSFWMLLKQVRKTMLDAYAHQDLPFERLVELFRPQRDLRYNPLFQTTFTLQNTPQTSFRLPGLTATPWEVDIGVALFDLRLEYFFREQQRLAGFIEYNTDLFDHKTIVNLVEWNQTLLRSVLMQPEVPFSKLIPSIGIERKDSSPLQPEEVPANLKDRLSQRRSRLSGRRDRLSAAQLAEFEKQLRGNEE